MKIHFIFLTDLVSRCIYIYYLLVSVVRYIITLVLTPSPPSRPVLFYRRHQRKTRITNMFSSGVSRHAKLENKKTRKQRFVERCTHRHIVPGLLTVAARNVIGNRKRKRFFVIP